MSACPENPHQPLICCQSCTGLYRGNSFQSYCPQSYCPQCYYRSFCQHPVHSPEEFAKFSDCTPKLDWCEQYFDECGEKNTAKKTTGDEKRQTGKPGTGAKKRTKKQKTDDGKKQTVGADNGANGSGRQITKDGSEQNGKTDLGANRSGRQSTEERYGQNAKRSIGTIRKGTLPTGDGNMQNDRLDNGPNRKGREPEGDGNKKSGKLGIGANKMGTQGNEPKRTEKKKTGDKNGPSNGDNGPTGQPPAPWPPQQGFPVHGMAPGTQGMHAIGPGIQGMQGMAPGSQGMQGMAPGTQGIQGMAAGTQYMQGMAPGSQGMQGMAAGTQAMQGMAPGTQGMQGTAPVSQFGAYGEQTGLPTPGAQAALTGNENGTTGMFANGAYGAMGQPPAPWPPQQGFPVHGMAPGAQGMHAIGPGIQGMQGMAPGSQGMQGMAPGTQGIQGMAAGTQYMQGMAPGTQGMQGMAPVSQFGVYGEQGGLPTPGAQVAVTGNEIGPTGMFANGANGPTGQPPAAWPPQEGFSLHGMPPGTQGMHGMAPLTQGMQGLAPGTQGMHGIAPGAQGIQGMATGSQGMHGMAPETHGIQGMAPGSQFRVYGEQEVHKQIPRYKDPGSMAIGYPPQLYQAPGGGPQDLLRYGQQALQANETYGRGEAQSAQSRKSQEKTGEDCEQSNPSSDAIHRVLQSLQLSFPENGLQNCCLLLPVNLDTANRIDEGDSKNGKELSLKRKLSKRDADSKKATSGGTPISKASMPASANTANGCSDCSPVVFPEQSMPSFCWNNSFFIQADECAQTGSSKPRKNSKELPPAVQCEPAPEEAPISSGFNTCCNAYCDSSYWPFYYYYDPCIGCYCWYPNPNYCNGQNCCPLNPLEKISEKPQHKEAPPVPAAAAPKKKKKIVRKKGGGPEQRSCNLGCTIPKCQTAAVSRDMRQAIIPRPHPVVAPLMGRLDWPTEFLDPSVG
ncbi:spidroin-2-like isoform X1 [Drosophila pseudoobscura]|uniref:Spidroin-2-like isoform X1 n=1 Tax=Drosophila pseudoobscura pseudoobscura TaxID=46245 RepID=A0A6I8V0W8_DROPS|nr:spidroin-2 isoform X1 [Drosophila pseudoobscura]